MRFAYRRRPSHQGARTEGERHIAEHLSVGPAFPANWGTKPRDEGNPQRLKPHPMQRLLQGDVGNGKTIVAGIACLAAVDSGAQAALMAPTGILSEQHWRKFNE